MEDSNNLFHKCEICDKEFKSKSGLQSHFFSVHGDGQKEIKCNICQTKFLSQNKLSSHMKRVHENKKYHKCDSSDKAFCRSGNLKEHKKCSS